MTIAKSVKILIGMFAVLAGLNIFLFSFAAWGMLPLSAKFLVQSFAVLFAVISVVGAVVILRRIKATMENEERVRVLLEAAPMPCYLIDSDYQVIDCNQASIELFVKEPGRTLSQTYPDQKNFGSCKSLECKDCGCRWHDDCVARKFLLDNYKYTFPDYEQNREQIERSIAERCAEALEAGIFRCDLLFVSFYGETIPCEVTIVPIKYKGGHGFAVYRRDLREEKLRKAAEKESQVKTQFLARMSHEIRTPMNAIIGMAELALRSDRLETAQEHVLTVKQAGTNLLSIINDILDISKVESGKLEIIPGDYHFAHLLNDVISIIRMKVMDSQLRFVVRIGGSIPNSLRGDEARVRQVLLNLLSNAVKYTDSDGFVSLHIHGEMGDADTVNMMIEVEDSGQGIKEEDMKNLFHEYTRFDMERNKSTEGTGLGLAITWHILKAMGGDIGVKSEYGKGSTFSATFPQKIRNKDSFYHIEDTREKSVLVYERRDMYADSLLFAVDSLGVGRTVVSDDAGLLENLSGGKHSAAFISFELYKKNINAILGLNTETKIVVMTEFGETVSDKNIAVLAMPVHSLSVASVLGGRDNPSYHGNIEFAVGFVAPAVSVIVVDDVLTNLKVVKGLLSPYEMQVSLCKSGEMALSTVKACRHDMIFMDHLMPGMDGVEATRLIRELGAEDRYFAEVPIVALTANAISGMREFFIENGFSDFMSKPVDVVKLNSILETWIPKEKRIKLSREHVGASFSCGSNSPNSIYSP